MRHVGVGAALVTLALLCGACSGSSDGGTRSTGGASTTAPGSSASTSAGSTVADSSTASGSSSRTAGPSTGSGTPTPVRTTIRQGLHATYTVRIWAQETATACAPYAHGAKIVAYLRAHPCRRLVRYLATTTANGKAVGVSGSTVTFGGATATAGQAAAGFAALVTDPATGGVDDLFGDGKRLPAGPTQLPTTYAANARNDGATVGIVDAWYLSGRTGADDPALSELLEAIT